MSDDQDRYIEKRKKKNSRSAWSHVDFIILSTRCHAQFFSLPLSLHRHDRFLWFELTTLINEMFVGFTLFSPMSMHDQAEFDIITLAFGMRHITRLIKHVDQQ